MFQGKVLYQNLECYHHQMSFLTASTPEYPVKHRLWWFLSLPLSAPARSRQHTLSISTVCVTTSLITLERLDRNSTHIHDALTRLQALVTIKHPVIHNPSLDWEILTQNKIQNDHFYMYDGLPCSRPHGPRGGVEV